MKPSLPEEVDAFLRDTAARADHLNFEWWRIELGSQWHGGLDNSAKRQIRALQRIRMAALNGR